MWIEIKNDEILKTKRIDAIRRFGDRSIGVVYKTGKVVRYDYESEEERDEKFEEISDDLL